MPRGGRQRGRWRGRCVLALRAHEGVEGGGGSMTGHTCDSLLVLRVVVVGVWAGVVRRQVVGLVVMRTETRGLARGVLLRGMCRYRVCKYSRLELVGPVQSSPPSA